MMAPSPNIKKYGTENTRSVRTTIARLYADLLASTSNNEHENHLPMYGGIEDYSILKKIRHGKHSIIFEGVNELNKEKVMIKMLQPDKKSKIKREIKILSCLAGGVNIVKLLSVVPIPHYNFSAMVFELLVKSEDFSSVYLKLSKDDSIYYLHELLKALDYCHNHQIMHRDVKPHNIIVDLENKKLRLINWSEAEIYHPGQEYSVKVGSKYFKGPELLVNYGFYDYSLDMWSFGCVLASMIFREEPFFHGEDNHDQLVQIVKVLGTSEITAYLRKYHINLDQSLQSKIGTHTKKTWQVFVNTENEYLVDNHALDLLEKLLKIDHKERITAKEAMRHKYFLKEHEHIGSAAGCSKNDGKIV